MGCTRNRSLGGQQSAPQHQPAADVVAFVCVRHILHMDYFSADIFHPCLIMHLLSLRVFCTGYISPSLDVTQIQRHYYTHKRALLPPPHSYGTCLHYIATTLQLNSFPRLLTSNYVKLIFPLINIQHNLSWCLFCNFRSRCN